MLLKYLNQLEVAVREAQCRPGADQYARCAECVVVLEDYLDGQVEPVRRRGREIMRKLIPSSVFSQLSQMSRPLSL
ncbi:MAG: hypothetical protein R3292_13845 [Alcanivorax sp.]|nr:hypothetical protein [Alcanivorax sp.]